jgi:serine phosphatase RsbU (regulator of sigma subunit)
MKIHSNFDELNKLIFILLSVFMTLALKAQKHDWQSYDIYLGDTVNVIENNNVKQGRWVFLGKDKKGKTYKFYKSHQLVETGYYEDGKKTGIWKSYHSNGKLEYEILFKNDTASGPAKFYTEDGKILAEGILNGEKYIGDYFIFDENGNTFKKNGSKKDQYAYLAFSGKVEKLGREINQVEITVFCENFEVYKTHNRADGSFDLKLELNFNYVVRFRKEGFHDQSIIVDANVYNLQDTSIYKLDKWKVQMTDNFANALSTDFMSLLLNKPSGKIYFNKKKKVFTSDGAYVSLFTNQVKDLSESTRLILAQTVEDNKKLEIENLRMESEKKLNEINMLKQAQELKETEIRKKEAEILAQKLEREKREKDLAIAEQLKRIKDLQFEQQQAELEQQQLEAEKNAKELEIAADLRKIQEYELKEKQNALNVSNQSLAVQMTENEKRAKELEFANRDKQLKEAELKQQMFYVWFLLGGVLLMTVFAIYIFRSFQQKKKANRLLEAQSKEISLQKFEIEEKSKLIEQKSIETEQSIQYARRIQHAILPPEEEIRQHIKDCFILYKPKDIVSGDFYFYSNNHDDAGRVYIASVDCTGHGVPGAFMSMIGHEKLKDAVDLEKEPGKILTELNKGVKMALRQSNESNSTRDGMDLALCAIHTKGNNGVTHVSYAGANRPLWLIRKDSAVIEEMKATKIAIGGLTQDDQEFEQYDMQLKKGDTVYLSSDGFADQFGGPKRKKLMTGKFKDLLVGIQQLSMEEQHTYLNSFIEDWMLGIEQVDDILVIGIKI